MFEQQSVNASGDIFKRNTSKSSYLCHTANGDNQNVSFI